MIKTQWDVKFEIGHQRIDFEHQIFLDLIRNVSEVLEKRAEKEYIHRLLTEIKMYAEFHFYSEETIMLEIAYPDIDEHQKEHVRLLSKYNTMLYKYHHCAASGEELVDFLFSWFALHTTTSDKRIVNYLKKKD